MTNTIIDRTGIFRKVLLCSWSAQRALTPEWQSVIGGVMNNLQGIGRNSKVKCQEMNIPEANAAQPESILMGSLEELSPEHQQPQQERYPDGTTTMYVTHPEANIQNLEQ